MAVVGGFEPSKGSLAIEQRRLCGQPIILRLSDTPHPRDRRVCLPISSHYNLITSYVYKIPLLPVPNRVPSS